MAPDANPDHYVNRQSHPTFDHGSFTSFSTSSHAPQRIPAPLTPTVELGVDTAYPTETFPFDSGPVDVCFDDESLTSLEKIYLFSRSKSSLHRSYMARKMAEFLDQVAPEEAVEYVLPLLNELAFDEDATVQDALASELTPTIRWFFTNCTLTNDPIWEDSEQIGEEPPFESDEENAGPLCKANLPSIIAILTSLILSADINAVANAKKTVVDLMIEPGSDEEQNAFIREQIIAQLILGMANWDSMTAVVPLEENAPIDESTEAEDAPAVTQVEPKSPVESSIDRPDNERRSSSDTSIPSLSNTPSSASSDASSLFSPDPLISSNGSNYTPSPLGVYVESPESTLECVEQQRPSLIGSYTVSEYGIIPVADDITPPATHNEQRHVASEGDRDRGDDESNTDAALGRLSSMSLIAAVVASDASSYLETPTVEHFVNEVKRVSMDPLYCIRVEASYAVGALAKIVPEEVAISSLLPIFESFARDAHMRVRQSSVFSLPNMLARLPYKQRRQLGIATLQRLSTDSEEDVRSAVLEILGETIYQFINDPLDVPPELLELFLGPRNHTDSSGQSTPDLRSHSLPSALDTEVRYTDLKKRTSGQSLRSLFEKKTNNFFNKYGQAPKDIFFSHPNRSLICAYNYPAVALTVGTKGWTGRVRDYYRELLQDTSYKIRHTLTASLAEVAKIIGGEKTREDLMEYWQQRLYDDDGQLRLLSVEHISILLDVLESTDRDQIINKLPTIWSECLSGWRERLAVVETFPKLARCGPTACITLRFLAFSGIRDPVAAIRTKVIETLPQLIPTLMNGPSASLDTSSLYDEIRALAYESNHRHRSTFIACYQTLTINQDSAHGFEIQQWLPDLAELSRDRVIGVRIGVARFTSKLCLEYFKYHRPQILHAVVNNLMADENSDVRSYVEVLASPESSIELPPILTSPTKSYAAFSSPPILSPTSLMSRDSLGMSRNSSYHGRMSNASDVSEGSAQSVEFAAHFTEIDEMPTEEQTTLMQLSEASREAFQLTLPVVANPWTGDFQSLPTPNNEAAGFLSGSESVQSNGYAMHDPFADSSPTDSNSVVDEFTKHTTEPHSISIISEDSVQNIALPHSPKSSTSEEIHYDELYTAGRSQDNEKQNFSPIMLDQQSSDFVSATDEFLENGDEEYEEPTTQLDLPSDLSSALARSPTAVSSFQIPIHLSDDKEDPIAPSHALSQPRVATPNKSLIQYPTVTSRASADSFHSMELHTVEEVNPWEAVLIAYNGDQVLTRIGSSSDLEQQKALASSEPWKQSRSRSGSTIITPGDLSLAADDNTNGIEYTSEVTFGQSSLMARMHLSKEEMHPTVSGNLDLTTSSDIHSPMAKA